MIELALFVITGAITGILSGLLGIGGGMVIVPILLILLPQDGFPADALMHVALGTSLASIMLTSIASARAHHQHGRVHWQTVRHLAPGTVIGTLLGAWLASRLHTHALQLFFVVFIFYVGTQMLRDRRPEGHHTLPGAAGLSLVGAGIGAVSSLVGIGGGSLTVPFLVGCRCHIREAVATSAALGFPIAVAGTIGYVSTGLHTTGLPPYSFGFVYLPAVIGITAASMLTAPIGAKLTHTLPVSTLKKTFAVLLFGLGFKMLFGIL
jgi:uncharacterized membrane protein YfcA